jgi:uncharacterized protein (DUF2062 family)
MSLTSRARNLFPTRRNGAKWVRAVQYLRSKNLWLLENGKAPTWGNK